MTDRLMDLVLQRDELAELDPAERRLAIRSIVAEGSGEARADAVAEVADAVDGYGPVSRLMADDEVTDVLINGENEIWVERAGALHPTDVVFRDAEQLHALIERLLAAAGKRADVSHPIADARLADGSRFHVVLPPLAQAGPVVSIRKFPRTGLSLDDLVARRTLSGADADLLAEYVRGRRTIAVTGGTGTGKTTLLNALLAHVPEHERIVIVEEVEELRPACAHAVSLVTRAPNLEGAGAVGLDVLVRAALRMRPDRIVVGEVRGTEALAALAAMSSGHEGSMVTLHARSPEDAVRRMATLALQGGSGATEASLVRQAADALHVVAHLVRKGAERRLGAVIVRE